MLCREAEHLYALAIQAEREGRLVDAALLVVRAARAQWPHYKHPRGE